MGVERIQKTQSVNKRGKTQNPVSLIITKKKERKRRSRKAQLCLKKKNSCSPPPLWPLPRLAATPLRLPPSASSASTSTSAAAPGSEPHDPVGAQNAVPEVQFLFFVEAPVARSSYPLNSEHSRDVAPGPEPLERRRLEAEEGVVLLRRGGRGCICCCCCCCCCC